MVRQMSTPLPYYGGKQRMASRIVKLLPKHSCYVEPFAGGLAVMFAKGIPDYIRTSNNSNYREVVNDSNQELIELWRGLQNDPALIHRLQYTPYSKAEYDKAKAETSAWAKYVNLCQSFAKQEGVGWGRSKLTDIRPDMLNSPATWANRLQSLPEVAERLRCVYLECGDAIKTITTWDSPFTCFYCDPPYPGTDQGHYKGYTVADFQRLVDTLDQCQGSFVLSNFDQPEANIPAHWERIEIARTSSAARNANKANGKRTEILWRRQAQPKTQEAKDALANAAAPRMRQLELLEVMPNGCVRWDL